MIFIRHGECRRRRIARNGLSSVRTCTRGEKYQNSLKKFQKKKKKRQPEENISKIVDDDGKTIVSHYVTNRQCSRRVRRSKTHKQGVCFFNVFFCRLLCSISRDVFDDFFTGNVGFETDIPDILEKRLTVGARRLGNNNIIL